MERNKEGLKTSKVYDFLNDPVLNQAAEDFENLSPEEQRLFNLSIDKSIRTKARKKSSAKKKVDFWLALHNNDPKHYDIQIYLEQITKDLEAQGLWVETPKEALESDLFPIDDLRDDDLDYNFNPKELTSIFSHKSIKKREKEKEKPEYVEKGLEWEDEGFISVSDMPQFTTPTSHNLLRRSSWSIEEKIARLMIEGTFFDKNLLPDDLFPCAYFFSKSIFDRKMFIRTKFEAFANTPLQKRFRTYPYRRYKQDQKLLLKLIHSVLRNYYLQHIEIKKSVSSYSRQNKLSSHREKQLLKSIWPRFLDVIKSLTPKQEAALNAVYVNEPQLTYTEAAKLEGISRDSFQDRIKGAIKKIKDAIPEFGFIEKDSLKTDSQKTNYLYDGLFHKASAKKVAPLYQICEFTGKRKEIPIRLEAPLENPDAPIKFVVRAWAIYHTPVPDFLDTEFYCGLIPEGAIRRRGGK